MAFGLAVFVYRRFSSDRGNPHLKIVEAPHKISHVKEDPQADEDPGKTKVTIFYGIQTGTAEGFAKALAQEAKAVFKVVDLGNERSVLLQQLTYGVFGLGNHQYKHFNKISKVVDEVLNEQGAKRLIPVVLGDDGQCIEDDFTAWRELLRLVIHDPTISAWEDKYANLVNGHAEFDIHHPWPSWDDLHQPKSAAGTNREDGARFQYSCGAHHQEASADHVQLQKVGVRWQSRIGCLWSRPRRVHAGVCSPAWCLSWQ